MQYLHQRLLLSFQYLHPMLLSAAELQPMQPQRRQSTRLLHLPEQLRPAQRHLCELLSNQRLCDLPDLELHPSVRCLQYRFSPLLCPNAMRPLPNSQLQQLQYQQYWQFHVQFMRNRILPGQEYVQSLLSKHCLLRELPERSERQTDLLLLCQYQTVPPQQYLLAQLRERRLSLLQYLSADQSYRYFDVLHLMHCQLLP
jgi:hypothetical protein